MPQHNKLSETSCFLRGGGRFNILLIILHLLPYVGDQILNRISLLLPRGGTTQSNRDFIVLQML